MHVVSSFEHSTLLELAITDLEQQGIARERIIAVPLDHRSDQSMLFDTIHRSDGIALMDGAAIAGTVGSVLGASYGFILEWGPIIWGLIGLAAGCVIGFSIDLAFNRKRLRRKNTSVATTEVVVIVECNKEQSRLVRDVLSRRHAIGIGMLEAAE
jgi:hypothetical protein